MLSVAVMRSVVVISREPGTGSGYGGQPTDARVDVATTRGGVVTQRGTQRLDPAEAGVVRARMMLPARTVVRVGDRLTIGSEVWLAEGPGEAIGGNLGHVEVSVKRIN